FANKVDEQKAFNNALSLIFVIATSLSLFFILGVAPITAALQESGNAQFVIWLSLVLWIDAMVAIPFARLRHEGKAKKFAVVLLLNIGLNIGLNLFFLLFCKGVYEGRFLPEMSDFVNSIYNPELGVGYVFLSNLIANALFIPLLVRNYKGYVFQLNKEYIKPMISYAVPLVFVGFAGMVNEMLDRILLKEAIPDNFYYGRSKLEALGTYGAAYKLSMLVGLVNQAFRFAAEPFFFSQSKEKNSGETYSLVLHYYVVFMTLAIVGLSVFRRELGAILIGSDILREGLYVLPILLGANVFLGIYMNISIWFKLSDKTYVGTIISIGAAIFTVALNITLIPIIGYLGCALTTLVCYFGMTVVCYVWGQKDYQINYHVSAVIRNLILASLFVLPSYFISFDSILLDALFASVVFVSFFILMYFLELKKLRGKA
ncbi:MAG: polysaccharide biosynthesis C-terminal domain-containing protein, partial [Saprospiraceae bacterium]|nr:polysaccharide biosynthesis C-terminal domain-containing protein [Saprospiraceae bacterium]